MRGLKFFITDVFGREKYSGNQLATFAGGGSLPESEMQKIAREINFSETTFIMSDRAGDGGYPVRIFTPAREIDFAGHPSLGTAYIINTHVAKQKADRVVLNLNVGQIPVVFSEEENNAILWMEQIEPSFGNSFGAGIIAGMLGLPGDALDASGPVQEVSTGLPHLIVPLKNLGALERAALDRELYFNLINEGLPPCVLVFCPEGHDASHAVSVRMFADYLGISEDPATGSGNGCLAAYLVRHRYFKSDRVDLAVGQGYEIGRPSLLRLKAEEDGNGRIRVSVGGSVIPIAEGVWFP
ncbi:MAG: PhzF family phenazine biosynthesis protein [Spirochaetes bacterium]|nr:PhzF family phenazine biosynthesis protein [Spirochaetota bacterium]